MKRILLSLLFLPLLSQAITPVFTCGAECGVSGTVGEHWTINNTSSFSTSTVRSGARSFRCNPTANIGYFSRNLSTNILVGRVYISFATLPTTNALFNYFTDGGATNKFGMYFKSSDSKVYTGYYDGTDHLGATGVSVTTNTWYRIDWKINSSTNPTTIDVQVDGVACGQSTVASTFTLSTYIFGFGLGSITTDAFFDDLIYSNTSGDYPIGAGYVNHFTLTSDGTHSGLTASDFQRTLTGTDILNSTTDSYLLLNDVPLESGASVDWINMSAPVASTYVENVFGPAPGISTPTVAPRMVSVIIGIHAAGTGAYNAEWLLNDNGTTGAIYTASAVAGVTTIIYKTLNLADPPSAATVWTLSGNGNFNNIRVRFGPTASVDANPDVYFDCGMIEAEFAEIVVTPHARRINWIINKP